VLSAALFGLPAAAQVYRCGNAYSSTPCAGGRVVDTSPPVTAHGDSQAGSTRLYLCQGYGGGQFWTRAHCTQRGALVERVESVPAGMSFAQQVEMAQNQQRSAQALTPPPPPAAMSAPFGGQAPQGAADLQAQCQALDARIRRLDAQARAGGRQPDMDEIARQRKEARDRQFRLRCH
jgi:hypothetical protein